MKILPLALLLALGISTISNPVAGKMIRPKFGYKFEIKELDNGEWSYIEIGELDNDDWSYIEDNGEWSYRDASIVTMNEKDSRSLVPGTGASRLAKFKKMLFAAIPIVLFIPIFFYTVQTATDKLKSKFSKDKTAGNQSKKGD